MSDHPADRVHSLMYVSRRRVSPPLDDGDIDHLVEGAQVFNSEHAVTGALIATHLFFAQHIEGPESVIAALIDRIRIDPRHYDVRVISQAQNAARLFAEWAMAYRGTARYFDRDIEPAIDGSAKSDQHSRRLLAHMIESERYERLKIR